MPMEWPTIIEGAIPILGGLYATALGYGVIGASPSPLSWGPRESATIIDRPEIRPLCKRLYPRMTHRSRVLLAFVIAPLAAPVGFFVFTVVYDAAVTGTTRLDVRTFLLSTPGSYLATLLIGLPSVIMLKRVGYLSASALLLFGVVGGAVVQVLFFAVFFGYRNLEFESWKFISRWIILGMALGLSVALSFCLIGGITWHSTRAHNSEK